MKSVRIYKDDIRVNILRSLFFTDTVLAVSGGLAVAGILYLIFRYIFHFFSWNIYLALVVIGEIAFMAVITQKIDNQAIYKIIPRGILFKTSKKELRQKELEPYFIDFSFQDNLIVRKNSIVRVVEVEPFDITLLNEQDREHFFVKMKQTIHILPSQVQLIVKKEKTRIENYSKHFFSLYDQSETKREPLIARYIKDFSHLVTTTNFLSTHHYAVFSVSCDTAKPHDKVKAIRKLNDIGIRFSSALSACNITVRPLSSEELTRFAKSTLR